MTPLDHALDLAAEGYAVFPCRPDKRPACPHGFKDATDDPDTLRDLWRRHPGVLVGVACGAASGVAVLDVDSAKHPKAGDWLTLNKHRLPATLGYQSRSGGSHWYFTYRDGLPSTHSKIAPGIDIQSTGTYVIHWARAGFPWLSGTGAPAWMPDWLYALASAPASVPPRPAAISQRAIAVSRTSGSGGRILERAIGLANTVATAGEGERNRVLYWAACRARDMIQACEVDQAAGNQLVETLHAAATQAGLQHHEITRTIQSALRATA